MKTALGPGLGSFRAVCSSVDCDSDFCTITPLHLFRQTVIPTAHLIMKQHSHEHSGLREHTAGHHKKLHGKQLYKDWRTWTAVALMLVAILIYVLTLDDSVVPVEQPGTGNQGPAAALSQP